MASMATPSGIRAGAAYIELFVKDKLQAGLLTAERRLRSFAAATNTMGRTLVATGIAAGMPIAFSIMAFSKFEAEMSGVRAITQAVGEDFEKLEKKARQLGQTTSFSAVEVAKGMKLLAMSDFSTEQILGGIEPVLTLARAGNVELDFAAETVANIGNAFGLAGEDIMRVVDVLAQAANMSSVNIDHMAETFKYLSPWAVAAGQSIEDMGIALAALGNVGIRASTAGTDLALVFKRLADTATRRKLEKALNISVTDPKTGKFKSFIQIAKEIAIASKNMSQIKKISLFADVFDRAGKSMLNLAMFPEMLDEMSAKMDENTGAGKRMASVMDDNLVGAFKRLRGAVEAVQIAIGKALEGSLRKIIEKGKEVTNVVERWFTRTPELAMNITKAVAGLLAIGGGLILFSLFLKLLTFMIMPLRKILVFVGLLTAKLVFALAPFFTIKGIVAIALAAIAMWLLKASGAADEIAAKWKKMTDSLKADWSASWSAILDAVKSGELSLAWEIMTATIELEWTRMVNSLSKTWIGFEHVMRGWWERTKILTKGGLLGWTAGIMEALLPAAEWVSINVFGEDEREVKQRIADTYQDIADMRLEIAKLSDELEKEDKKSFEIGAGAVGILDEETAKKQKHLDELRAKAHKAAQDLANREDEEYRKNMLKKKQDDVAAAVEAVEYGKVFGTFSSPGALRIHAPVKDVQKEILETNRQMLKKMDKEIDAVKNLELVYTA